MKSSWKLLIGLLLGPMMITAAPQNGTPTAAADYLVYVASYAPQGTGGIYVFRFNPQTAEMSALELAAPLDNPAWIAIDPNHRFLYAVTRHEDRAASLHAFRIDKATGRLAELNSTPSGVKDACYISIDHTGTSVAVSACEDGAIAIHRIKADGSLGDQTAAVRHSGPGARVGSVYFSPDNRFLLSPDLGLDEVFVDRFDSAKGALAPNDPPFTKMQSGSTPNRLAFRSKWEIRLCVQCNRGSADDIQLGCGTRGNERVAENRHCPGWIHREEQRPGSAGASEWEISVRGQRRSRASRGICHRCGWLPHAGRSGLHAGRSSYRFCH